MANVMKKRLFIEGIIAFALFTVLMAFGTDTVESIHKGIWHALSDLGVGRTEAEILGACSVLWAVMWFSRAAVSFFFGLADKKSKKSEE